jgi:YggT family protein
VGTFVATFAGILLVVLWLAVLGRVLLSWFDASGSSRVARVLIQVTEPILAPVRRFLPQGGTLDFSPILVLLVLGALWRALLR